MLFYLFLDYTEYLQNTFGPLACPMFIFSCAGAVAVVAAACATFVKIFA